MMGIYFHLFSYGLEEVRTDPLLMPSVICFPWYVRVIVWRNGIRMRSWLGDHIELFYIHYFSLRNQDGPYHSDSTASRLLSEVKHCRVELVLRWGTTLESSMFIFCFLAFCFLVWSLFWPIACWCFVVVYSSTSSTSCGCSCLPDFCLFGLLWLQQLGCLVAASLSTMMW